MERSSGAIRTACDIQIDGRRGAGRPKLTWKKLTERDCREWKLMRVDPQERSTWRSGVRSAMQLASYLERGPLMWMMPLHLNQKSDYYMMMLMFVGFLRVLNDNQTGENLQCFILVRKSICFMFFYYSVCAFTIINNYYIQIKTDRNMHVQNIANKSALT